MAISKRVASIAGRQLRSKNTPKPTKSVDGAALESARRKGSRKK